MLVSALSACMLTRSRVPYRRYQNALVLLLLLTVDDGCFVVITSINEIILGGEESDLLHKYGSLVCLIRSRPGIK
jgi:hypothetical protein